MILNIPYIFSLIGMGLAAGSLGALTGVGGGILIVPALVLLFGVDIKVAVATSLLAVIATSTSVGSVYVGRGLAHLRLGMSLEIPTALGGMFGGLVASRMHPTVLYLTFSVMMTFMSALIWRTRKEDGDSADADKFPPVKAKGLALGGAASFFAGVISGLLGVGGGFIKVPAMALGMGVPIKVSTATSSVMIGVTAAASVFIYLSRGYVHPLLVAPVVFGVVGGSFLGTRVVHKISSQMLKRILAALLFFVAIQMLYRSWAGGL